MEVEIIIKMETEAAEIDQLKIAEAERELEVEEKERK